MGSLSIFKSLSFAALLSGDTATWCTERLEKSVFDKLFVDMVQGNPNGKPKGAKDTKPRQRKQLTETEKAKRKVTVSKNANKLIGQPDISGFFTAAHGGEG